MIMTRDGSTPCTHASTGTLTTDFTCVCSTSVPYFQCQFHICHLHFIDNCRANANDIREDAMRFTYKLYHTYTYSPCIRKCHRNNVDTQIFNQTYANRFGLFLFWPYSFYICFSANTGTFNVIPVFDSK